MTIFTLPKNVEDVEEAELLEEDYYLCEITSEPELIPNKKMEEGVSEEEGAGHNLVIKVATATGDENSGRWFSLYFPWPTLADEEKRDRRGNKVSDKKITDITNFVEAFGGSVEGTDIILKKGLTGKCYVTQELNSFSGKIENNISPFGDFKPSE